MEFAGKKIMVVGAGVSGFAVARLAKRYGAVVYLSDAKKEADIKYDLSELRDLGVIFCLGQQDAELSKTMDLVVVSPAVPIGIPLLQSARAAGIPVISEVELAYQLAKSPIYAITGTNGKTTTTTLLGELMKSVGGEVGIGGNIGTPLCEEAVRIGDKGCLVAEISSYQMEASEKFHPAIAVVLNITPDHLARHKTMEAYQQAKEKLFSQQTGEDFLILNYDDLHTREMAARAKSQVLFFSRKEILSEGAFVEDGFLVIQWQQKKTVICRVADLQIQGAHNVENALAAMAAAWLAGVDAVHIKAVLQSFQGVEHRIEPVRKYHGVMYYNDSKATNPEAAIKALEAFSEPIVLLAGGHDKNTGLEEMMDLVCQKVKDLILLGDAAARFKEAAQKAGFAADHIYDAGYSMEKAVELAAQLAESPQVVLLSPACASFDMFDDYEARGRKFKEIVQGLC